MKSNIRKLCDFLAPRDHAGRGCYDSNARIPPSAWALAAVFVACWVGFANLAHGAGF